MRQAVLALILAGPAAAADLPSVVARALARSPAMAEARARRAQADAAGREAKMSRLPRLSAAASVLRSDDPLFSFGTLLRERRVSASDFNPAAVNDPGYRTFTSGALEFGLPLFTGFELSRASELAALAGRRADAASGGAAQGLRLRVAFAYLDSVADRSLLAELDERIASSSREVSRAERLRRQGLILGSDHQAALAILAGLRARRAQAAAARAAHEAELAVLIGSKPPELSGSLGAWTPPLESDEELVAAALSARPDLRAAGLRKDEAGVRSRGARQSILPAVEAFAALQANDYASARLAGVRARLPFGDPAYLARRDRAKADEDAAGQARAALEDQARAEVLALAASVRGTGAVLSELEESLARARQALEEVRPLYREGRQSVMEVLRAEEAAARLVEASLEARRRLRSDWASLRAAQGSLDDEAVAILGRSLEAPR